MIKFPSIEQFRSTVKRVTDRAKYHNESPPTLEFRGTVKLHGTNASIVLHPDGTHQVQSRNQVVKDGHFGFFEYVNENIETIKSNVHCHVNTRTPVTIYGEWCGEGIQKKIALAELPKMFVVFAISFGEGEDRVWKDFWKLDDNIDFNALKRIGIYDINSFETYSMLIDFNNPALVQNDMIEITNEVEKECPVGKHFGVSGTGEGVVWKCISHGYQSSDYWFKVKGEKHSVSKVKTLAEVDIAKLSSIQEFIDRTVTENRLKQGIEYLNEMGIEPSQKSTGTFLSWVFKDIEKEEGDVMEASGLTKKDVSRDIGKTARVWYFNYLDKM